MSENLKITDCGALTEIQNQLEQFSPRGSWHVLRNMENSLGKKIKVLSEKKLWFLFKIDENIDFKMKIKTKGNVRAAMEALCYYLMLHGAKRVLCAKCELNGTEECLEYFLCSGLQKERRKKQLAFNLGKQKASLRRLFY